MSKSVLGVFEQYTVRYVNGTHIDMQIDMQQSFVCLFAYRKPIYLHVYLLAVSTSK